MKTNAKSGMYLKFNQEPSEIVSLALYLRIKQLYSCIEL